MTTWHEAVISTLDIPLDALLHLDELTLRREDWKLTPYLEELEAAEELYGDLGSGSWPNDAIELVVRAAAYVAGYREGLRHEG